MLESELYDRENSDNAGGGRAAGELSPPAPSVPAAVFQPPPVVFQPPAMRTEPVATPPSEPFSPASWAIDQSSKQSRTCEVAAHHSDVPVIAKLEKPQAIDHLEEILEVADGVMVARGDLGVEVAPEKVPVIQKQVIRRAAAWRKPVITATQMLESMIENPRPTRAEASDVANAIFDGSDAVMLSAETATGRYPREAVAMMARIVVEAECNMSDFTQPRRRRDHRGLSVAETICESIAHSAEELPMGAIVVFTETGNTARMISKHRPQVPIYAFTHSLPVVQRVNLYWGVHPVRCRQAKSAEQMVTMAEQELLRRGLLKPGEVLGVVAGTRQASGSTNFMRLHQVSTEEASAAIRFKQTSIKLKERTRRRK